MRAPVVAGVCPGVGASTVAAALHAHDAGTRTTGADVLVCRPEHLHTLAARGPVPAVVAGPGVAVRAPVGVGPVAVLPHVEALPELRLDQVAALLARPPARLGPELRAYADALRALAAVLVTGGALAGGPPVRRLWRGLGPVERRVMPPSAPGGPDDETLEAALWATAGGLADATVAGGKAA